MDKEIALWIVLGLSFVTFLVTIVISVSTIMQSRKYGSVLKSSLFPIALVGIFLSILPITIASHFIIGDDYAGESIPMGIIAGLFDAIQMFGANLGMNLNSLPLESGTPIRSIYIHYIGVLYILAPVTTLGTIFTLLGNLFHFPVIVFLSLWCDTYIFSNLNIQSATLAKSVRAHCGHRCLIIFGNVDESVTQELRDSIRGKHTYLVRYSVGWLQRAVSGGRKGRTYVFCSDDETANLDASIRLTQDLSGEKGKHRYAVIPFCTSPAAGFLLDAAAQDWEKRVDKQSINLRRFDWARYTAYMLLSHYPLFVLGEPSGSEKGRPVANYGDQETHVLIVGDGALSREYLRGVLWARCLGKDTLVRITVIAQDVKALEAWARGVFPDLLEEERAVEFLERGPESEEFEKWLSTNVYGPSIVLVDMGDDLLSARVALHMRELTERCAVRSGARNERKLPTWRPAILAAVKDSAVAHMLAGSRSMGKPFNVYPVGTNEDVYCYESVFDSVLERYARNVNRAYGDVYDRQASDGDGKRDERAAKRALADREFEMSEYCRRSSAATAVHLKYGLFVYCRNLLHGAHGVAFNAKVVNRIRDIDWSKDLGDFDDDLLESYTEYVTEEIARVESSGENGNDWLREMEHDRWCAYMRSEGYQKADAAELELCYRITKRDQYSLARLHGCLVPYEELKTVDSEYGGISGEDKCFELNDAKMVKHLIDIIRDE